MHITLDWMMWQFGRPHGSRRGRRGRIKRLYNHYELAKLCEADLRKEAEKLAREELKAQTEQYIRELGERVSDEELERLQSEAILLKRIKEILQILIEIQLEFMRENDDIEALLLCLP